MIHAALAPRVRRSPIGTYEVRRNGSVEGLPMALYKLRGDRFEFVRTLLLRADFLRVKQSCDLAQPSRTVRRMPRQFGATIS